MMGLRGFKAAIAATGCFAFLALAPSAMAAVTITASPKDANDDTITAPLTVGQVFHSGVSVGGTTGVGGDLTFGTYPPSDPTCSGTPIDFVSFTGIDNGLGTGNSGYLSGDPGAIAMEVGQYKESATLTGGPDGGATMTCVNAFTTIKTHPSLAVVPSATTVVAGSPVHATATLTGAFTPTIHATVRIYGPDDPTCAGIAPVSDADVPGPGPVYVGPAFTPTTTGTYHAKAIFEGDANNDGATANCGPTTAFEVTPAPAPPSGGGSTAATGERAAALKKCKKKKSKKAKKKCRKKAAKLPL
jgi:hypothetical protein